MIEQKILEIFTKSGLSRIEFAERLGISNAVLSHLASGRNKASLDLVISVLSQFPDINPEWLILNVGEMYRTDNQDKRKKWNEQLINQLNQIKTDSKKQIEAVNILLEDLEKNI